MCFYWCVCAYFVQAIPDREGPIYFGDDINRHVISYNFFVKDSMARGFQVKYSFLLITWNQTLLMNLWPFVVSRLGLFNRHSRCFFGMLYT